MSLHELPKNPSPDALSSQAEFLSEFCRLVEKYGVQTKFGLTSLHRHFDVSSTERFLESVQATSRTLAIQVIDEADPKFREAIPTVWRVDDGALVALQGCGGCKD